MIIVRFNSYINGRCWRPFLHYLQVPMEIWKILVSMYFNRLSSVKTKNMVIEVSEYAFVHFLQLFLSFPQPAWHSAPLYT